MNKLNKILAFCVAIGLAIGEAILNWGNWQYTPLWIVDYIIVIWLLLGVFHKTKSKNILFGAWCFSFGVMYMALGVSTDPKDVHSVDQNVIKLYLIGLLITCSLVGLILSFLSLNKKDN
ncbi:hypothetical protein [Urechidicola croceus]|uniref:Uncharacterized protein n=1 Tax=Urechidicola croceus TaxID=1850246 RepID=A0A1D8P7D4_9FLAO|nr:hypothetical protein [Urechidicola croceus]AOW20476.1 hypothetical protein LPB138_07225 [Urechidicola croceus]